MPSSPTPNLSHLNWKSTNGHQTATDASHFCIRESAGSIIAGVIFGVGIAGTSAACEMLAEQGIALPPREHGSNIALPHKHHDANSSHVL